MTIHQRDFRYPVFKLVIVVLTLIGMELIVRFAAKTGRCPIRTYQVASSPDDLTFIGDINPHFGVWHIPQTTVMVTTPEGKVSYETNSHGMRDQPRSEKSSAAERVVVLGDSFVEGPYVEESDRVTDILEKQTGIEFLNFGTSGSFGSIQEWLLYKHLATRFDHTRVFIFHLPDNDFDDNDVSKHAPDRYRPYLSKVGESYEVVYPVPFQNAPASLFRISKRHKLQHMLYNNWYTLNLIIQCDFPAVKDFFQSRTATAPYDDFSQEDLNKLLFSYRQIIEFAKPRPVTIFVIPRDKDFMAYQAGRFKGRIIAHLSRFAASQDGVEVIDLMPAFLAHMKKNDVSHKKFFLPFDPHWSPMGHCIAADAALESSLF